jgi:hypothetical protein
MTGKSGFEIAECSKGPKMGGIGKGSPAATSASITGMTHLAGQLGKSI